MTADHHDLSWDEWDEMKDPRPARNDFDDVVDQALSRRGFLAGIMAFGSGASVMGVLGSSGSALATGSQNARFAFDAIPAATDATIHVPSGYSWRALAKWGDPLFSDAADFDPATGIDAASAARVFGENTDGMELFNVDGHELIAVNHEYVNPKVNLPGNEDGMPVSPEDVGKLQNLQGVSVMEIDRDADGWHIVVDSPFNRRITHQTPMRLSGPAAGHDLLKTSADAAGTEVMGTLNNCGAGKTPWGTYLTCEENFNGYFGSTSAEVEISPAFNRYGIGAEGRYAYEKFDARFDISKEPNEPNRFGYIVEIDPANPDSTPVKRTALGRFKHENAACVIAPDGRVVVYMGDDERGEYLYKYVSNRPYQSGGQTDGLLDDGQLHVAKFNADGTGEWIALTPEATGMEEAEILIHTRMAASAAGGTTMDRPEWVAVNPLAAEAYCALTNNSRRGTKDEGGALRTNAGGDAMAVNAPNPREANEYGQIVRWFPANDDHATTAFRWDLYVMAGNPSVHSDAYAGSANVNAGNLFNSPDGMMFDSTGILWIQTDGDDSNEGDFAGMGNNQMLAGDPVTGEIARFLTAPVGAEVTGLTWSSDRRAMFVGIQHPAAPFPDGADSLPRSTVVVVTRDDGGPVG